METYFPDNAWRKIIPLCFFGAYALYFTISHIWMMKARRELSPLALNTKNLNNVEPKQNK